MPSTRCNAFKLLVFLLFFVVSCSHKQADVAATVDDFAVVECRAIVLRQQRFELASEIRLIQDSLLQTTNIVAAKKLKQKLQVLERNKELMLNSSLLLADSIKQQLSLMMRNLNTPAKKEAFNTKLTVALQQRGCVE